MPCKITATLFTQQQKFKLYNSTACLQTFHKTLRNHHMNVKFKRQTGAHCIIKNMYQFSIFILNYLQEVKSSVRKHIVKQITSFQTLAVMHDLHYFKT